MVNQIVIQMVFHLILFLLNYEQVYFLLSLFVSFSANSLLFVFAHFSSGLLAFKRGILEILLCIQRVGWCARVRFFYISEEGKNVLKIVAQNYDYVHNSQKYRVLRDYVRVSEVAFLRRLL